MSSRLSINSGLSSPLSSHHCSLCDDNDEVEDFPPFSDYLSDKYPSTRKNPKRQSLSSTSKAFHPTSNSLSLPTPALVTSHTSRLDRLSTLVSIGEYDPAQIVSVLDPSFDPDPDPNPGEGNESSLSLARHLIKTYLARTSYLARVPLEDIEEAIRVWDIGSAEVRLAKDLRDGKARPATSGGCWPARVAASDEGNATIFIGGLTGEVTVEYLTAPFAVFGPFSGVKVLAPRNGTSHCGFVHYIHRQDAEVAVRVMQGFEMMGSRLRISWGRSTTHQLQMRAENGDSNATHMQVSTAALRSRERTDRTRSMDSSVSVGPAMSIDPVKIVEVAKQVQVDTAQSLLKLLEDKFDGDTKAFFETLKTVLAIKGVSPSTDSPPNVDKTRHSPKDALKDGQFPNFSHGYNNNGTNIWSNGNPFPPPQNERSSMSSSTDFVPPIPDNWSDESDSTNTKLATPPPVASIPSAIGSERPYASSTAYDSRTSLLANSRTQRSVVSQGPAGKQGTGVPWGREWKGTSWGGSGESVQGWEGGLGFQAQTTSLGRSGT